MNKRNITGIKFNHYTAIKHIKTIKTVSYWEFRCQCGNKRIKARKSVVTGANKSCGCVKLKINQLKDYQVKTLVILYTKGKSVAKLAIQFKVSQNVIRLFLKKKGILKKGTSKRALTKKQVSKLILLYESGISGRSLSDIFKISDKTTLNYLHKNNVKIRSLSESQYKGSRTKNSHGYITVHVLPKDYKYKVSNRPNMLEHRLIMSRHLNRKLKRYENVHHINGIRDDNRLENLELWSSSQVPGQRVIDKIK